jgi:predicted ATPase/DNA-binding SARP family transcriptional activator
VARRISVLGPLEVTIDGVDATPRAPKERSLLAILALRPGGVVDADTLVDELWPDLDVDRARRVLWVRISGLRKCLGRAGASGLLEHAAPGYRLCVDPDVVDAGRFERLVAEGRGALDGGDRAAAASMLREALAMWRGDPLVDARGCLLLEREARRLGDVRLDAIEDWIEAELACGRHLHLLAELERLVDGHPLRERLCTQRVIALYRCGRPADALSGCRELAARLVEELGVRTSPHLQELEEAMLAHDPRLDAPWPQFTGAISEPEPIVPRRSNLPAPPDRFIGRAGEQARLVELLGDHRLVTLAGPAGVGKTRLALEVAAVELDRRRDGVWLVELAPVRNPDDVPLTACRALGLVPRAGDDPDDTVALLANYLAERQALLVIDNAEHLVDAVANLVHEVLARCPTVRVVVTSTELLHVAGEAVFDLPPLPLPEAERPSATSDATALFVERARAASLSFTMSVATAGAVAQICRRLDGIPLAIELAAARVRVLSAEQIADRLDDRFGLLVDGARVIVPERHRTLRAAIDWSHGLLTVAERAALRRLAIFPGRFDLEAGVAVIEGTRPLPGGAGDGLALVSRLVDKSLLVVEAGDDIRFRLLDSIRQYAGEKLAAAGEEEAAHHCHRDVFVERSGPLWPLMTAHERHRGLADEGNLRAALEWAWHERDIVAALHLTTHMTNTWLLVGAQGVAWMERVLDASRAIGDPARARLMCDLVLHLEDTTGHIARRQALLDDAAELAAHIDDPAESAALELSRAETLVTWGRLDEARSLAASALRTYDRLGLTLGICWCHHSLGWIAVAAGDVATARSEFELALECARTVGREWVLPHVLAALAPLMALAGDCSGGVATAAEAVDAARAFRSPPTLAMALTRAAETAIIADQPAAPLLVELLRLLLEVGMRRWAADALEMSAVVFVRCRAMQEAAEALAAATRLRLAANEPPGGVRTLAAEVCRTNDDLVAELAQDDLAAVAARAQSISAERAMTAAANALGAT